MSNEVQFEIMGDKPPQSPATGRFEQTQGARRVPHGEAKDGLAAFLLCHRNRLEVGEPIPLSYGIVLVGSGSNEETRKLRANIWQPYYPFDPGNYSWFEVTESDRQNVPYSGEKVSWPAESPSDENTTVLHHGDFFGRTHRDLSEGGAFVLTKPGKYKVRWAYAPFPATGVWGGKLLSNEVQFELVGKKPPRAPVTGKLGETQEVSHFPHGKMKDGLAASLTCHGNQRRKAWRMPVGRNRSSAA